MPVIEIAERLAAAVRDLRFGPPAAYVYRPLDYAWEAHRQYLERYSAGTKEVLFVGMNPGPWGMAQNGVPFGATSPVRDWLGIDAAIGRPEREHPKRPVTGLDCAREEVSGRRVWGWAREVFGTPDRFFARFFVHNYIPLLFLEESGRNLVPEKLRAAERDALLEPCDRALRDTVLALGKPRIIGVGTFAEAQARRAVADLDLVVGRILHPSPASPAANRGWAAQATAQLRAQGVVLPG